MQKLWSPIGHGNHLFVAPFLDKYSGQQTGGTMMGDRTKTDPEATNTQPGGAGGDARAAAGNADDAHGAPSMAELARRLAERTARQQAVDPAAAAATRRAALEAYDLARERRLIVALSAVLALTVGAAVAYFVSTIESRPLVQLPSAAAQPEVGTVPRDFKCRGGPCSSRPFAPTRRRRRGRRARGNAGAACGRQPTGPCRGDAGQVPAAKQRRQGDPGKTAVLWLQSRAGRRNRRAPDRSGRHALPAGERPGADRRDRPSTAGAASPGSRTPGCPANRPAWPKARRTREPPVRIAALRPVRARAGCGQSPRPMAGFPGPLNSSVPPAELSATASAVDRSFR